MPTQPTSFPPREATNPLVAVAFIAFAAVNLYLLGWVAPTLVTRAESSAGFRATVGEAFGNAPTVGRVVVGRAR